MFPPTFNLYITTPIPYYFPPYLLVHTALPGLHTHETPTQSNATTTSVKLYDKAWYPDSGAANHFTQGPGTHPYLGTCKVQVANGSYLDIRIIGTFVINTSYKPLV